MFATTENQGLSELHSQYAPNVTKRPFLPYLFPRKGKDRAAGGTSETASTERVPAPCAKPLILCARFLLFLWRFSPFQDTIQCSATHRKEKAPGEVQVKMIVETVKLAAFILCILEKYDAIRNPVGRFSFLKNSAFSAQNPMWGYENTRCAYKKHPPGELPHGLVVCYNTAIG